MQARAYAAAEAGARLAPTTIERREVGPRDVSIEIDACGVRGCDHSHSSAPFFHS